MNGCLYDAEVGRMMQADPFIQSPANLQNYNQYSYILNNPMSYTDPSGYFFDKLFKILNKLLVDFAPILGIALLAIPGVREWTLVSGWHAALFGFGTGGVATGSLKGALIGALVRANTYSGLYMANGSAPSDGLLLEFGQDIAGHHLDATAADTSSVWYYLSAPEITAYHHAVFDDFGVKRGFYGGSMIHGRHDLTYEVFYCQPACDLGRYW